MPPARRLDQLSNTRIDRAGKRLRRWYDGEDAKLIHTDEDLRQAALDFFAWRDTFRYPLTKVVMGLRSFVRSEHPDFKVAGVKLPVGQRLKREPQILRKLLRYPSMKLSRMQDVGGCRAIMPGGQEEVARVLERIRTRWDVAGAVQDYVANPQATGYRAIHVVVMRDERRTEVQLRTPGQHQWAVAVERTGLRARMNLKAGEGDPDLLRYFELAAAGIALEEAGLPADERIDAELIELRASVRHYFRNPS